MSSGLGKNTFTYFVLTAVNCFVIYLLFPVISSLFWLFMTLVIAATGLDLLAMAWSLGLLPYNGFLSSEMIGAIWTMEQLVQTIILLAFTSMVPLPLLFAVFILLLYFGKIRSEAMRRMFDSRPAEKENR